MQAHLENLGQDERVTWICWQWEKAPTTGQVHAQGAIWWKQPKTMTPNKTALETHVHLQIARGTAEKNKRYCSKPGGDGFTEVGVMPQAGRRKDLEEIAQDVKDKGLKAAIEANPGAYIRYHAGMKALGAHYDAQAPMVTRKVKVIVLYQLGTGGAGKSHAAEHYDRPEHTWVAGDKLPRLVGYNGQRTVVVDEMDGKRMTYSDFKLFCDEAVKGWYSGFAGDVKGLWDTIIFTSNTEPWNWYKEDAWQHGGGGRSPLQRRIDQVYCLYGDYEKDPTSVVWTDENGVTQAPLGKRPGTEDPAPAPAPAVQDDGKDEESETEDPGAYQGDDDLTPLTEEERYFQDAIDLTQWPPTGPTQDLGASQ